MPQRIIERDGPVVTLTLNGPEARDAFDLGMLACLADAWVMIDEDPALRVTSRRGSDGTFCAGADHKAMCSEHGSGPWKQRFLGDPERAWKAMLRNYRPRKPMIAAVDGYCVAGGMELLQGTDIRVASESGHFGLTEARGSLFPRRGSTGRLKKQIPYTKAMEILLSGEPIDDAEALQWGLTGRVVPADSVQTEARRSPGRIAENGPLAVQAIKRSVQETEGISEEEGLKPELETGQPFFSPRDAREGSRAFTEKRKPNFLGR